jgi:hypothetical protein
LASPVGETHDCERRHTPLEVGLNLDPARIEPDERMRDGSREHVATLGDNP